MKYKRNIGCWQSFDVGYSFNFTDFKYFFKLDRIN